MLIFEIKRSKREKTQRAKDLPDLNRASTTLTTQAERADAFRNHFTRFWGDVGSKVVFKKPKRNKTEWEVVEVVKRPEDCAWTNGGRTPNYIRLKGMVKGTNGQLKETTVWTCENKLLPIGPRK